ncbi:biotin transporter BioY [Cardinium endosymbiont of Culicoides punctatus]|uniref:biotin transporter BioY n=1 Tax=Cardinium endosymbiont of Culicoides punctatus TaxID=2304601 RepID=UPI0010588D25|nr:biotin transporter BioY [Cardinium endosymbiont of Culicoides punctatus]TDG95696.1 Biotin transporter BioY [Cardinium endosymbiont of Culicoides punctatus]
MNTRDIAYVALFAAITAVLGIMPLIRIPVIPVPITAQSLGLMLAGSILGSKKGALAQILFLGLVALGFPLLSGGRGGIGSFLEPSSGFLLGWPIGAFVIGFLFEKKWSSLTHSKAFIYMIIGGILVVYATGTLWLNLITHISLIKAWSGSMLFIPGDLVKAFIGTTTAMVIKASYPIIKKNK